MIKEMNSTFRGSVIFDYGWLFRNELTKSIRVFENECRFEFNEKIIGSFYNENLLFREIVKKFGNDYKIISQRKQAVNECQPLTLDIKRRMIRTHQVSFS